VHNLAGSQIPNWFLEERVCLFPHSGVSMAPPVVFVHQLGPVSLSILYVLGISVHHEVLQKLKSV